MTDQPTSDAAQGPVCPWCSAALPAASAVQCPSCGASLISEADEALPGLTAIDAGAIVRAKQVAIRPRSRLFSWLSGDDSDDVFTKAEGNALEPPELDVRREIFRMELEAEVANLQAENEAILAEAVAEGRVVDVPPELADAAGIVLPSVAPDAPTDTDVPTPGVNAATVSATIGDAPAADAPAADLPAAPDAPAAEAEAPAAIDPPADKGSRKRR